MRARSDLDYNGTRTYNNYTRVRTALLYYCLLGYVWRHMVAAVPYPLLLQYLQLY